MRKQNDVLVLIPTRLNSRRLPAKALLPINKIPLIIHVYKRTLLSKQVGEAIICCDDQKIIKDISRNFVILIAFGLQYFVVKVCITCYSIRNTSLGIGSWEAQSVLFYYENK